MAIEPTVHGSVVDVNAAAAEAAVERRRQKMIGAAIEDVARGIANKTGVALEDVVAVLKAWMECG